ncbi:FkbM family methyltransferase [Jhaorihella thermophila]|uniref:Methyltransferase, FkbM family n=1 Tax=Jhaorihella thermophila TaxID=488547 RepID=A0A1H5WVU6_9RHOB|nr:FkbM family methyltransferase [Jhaorihella thermophila]SEG03405.1 methyltransferase, FkbM family [Jhaorihella thermophila]
MLTRLRKMIYRARGHYAGQLGGERFRLDPYHSKFWRKAGSGAWEPETFAVLRAHLAPDRDYLDIGAWIGPTVLFGARRARHVWCFEPDPTAFRHLAWNIELNGLRNVSAFPVALSEGFGVARMASFGGEAGDSMSSLLNAGGAGATEVLTIGWEQFASAVDLSGVSLVKVDIEGAEFDLLPTLLPWLERHRPALFLSTHAPYLDPDTRADRMRRLAESLSFYSTWQDKRLRPTGPGALTQDPALTGFETYLLTP